jgi:autotransporter-associated beta strand protein
MTNRVQTHPRSILECLAHLKPHKFFVIVLTLAGLWGGNASAQLLHRYDFNTTNDTVGTANGVLRGTATLSNGGLVTTGVGGQLSGGIPQNSFYLPAAAVAGITNAFTIETWFVANYNGGFCTLFSFSANNTANYVLATPARGNSPYASSVSVIGGGGSATEQQAAEQYQDNGQLHDMTVTFDGTNLSYYIDGALGSFSGLPNTISDSGLVLSNLTYIGVNGGSPYGDNCIKGTNFDFRIYGQALTSAQVATIYALGKDASTSSITNALVPATAFVWNGGGANDKWSTGLNWVGGTAPSTSGTSLTFAGGTRTTPNLDASYSVTGLVFSNNASSFTLGTTNSSTLTSLGDVVNNSANTQTFNVPLSVGGGVALNASAGNLVLNSNITLTGTLSLTGNNNFTLNGNVTGSGTFAKNGAGTLTFGGATLSAGTVTFNNGTTLFSSTVFSAGGKTYIGYLTNNAVVTMSGGTFNTGDEVRVGGSDQNGSAYNGTGTFTMNGGTANLSALTVARGNYLDNSVSGTVTLNSGSTMISTNDAILQFAGSGLGKLAINGGTFIIGPTGLRWLMMGFYDSGAGELDITNGNLFLENSSSLKMCRSGNTGANVVNQIGGAVTFFSDAGVTLGGTGNLDLNYAGTFFSSSTYNLNGGTLTVPQIIVSGTLGSGIFNFNGGTLKPTASTTTFMQGLTHAYVNAGGAIIDTAGKNITIGQLLEDSGGGLTKNGAGTLTLSGGYNYTGPTVVNAGTLSLDTAQTSAVNTLAVTNAALSLSLNNGSSSLSVGTVVFNGSTALNLNFGTATAPSATAINANGYTVSVTGTNTINITGQSLVVGQYPLISTGSSMPTNNFKLGTLPTGVIAVLTNSGASLDLLVTASGQSLTWYGADNSGNPLTVWNINTSSNWNSGNAKYLQYAGNSYGDNVLFDDNLFTPASANITLNTTVVPASVTFNNSSTPYSITGSGSIGGVTAVTLANSGSLYLGSSNSYTGGTMINAGVLAVTNDSALGASSSAVTLSSGTLQFSNSTVSTRSISVVSNSTIAVAANANVQLSGAISGSVTLTKNDLGTLTVSNIPYAGLINFNNGTGVIAGAVSPAGSEFWVTDGAGNQATVNVPATGTLTVSNWLVVGRTGGAGTLNVNGGKVIHAGGGNITLGTLGTAPVGTINLNSGSISNLVGETYLGEGSSTTDFGNYNQSGGIASLGNFYVGHGAGGGQGIGTANVTGGTLNVANLEIGFGNNNTRVGTNVMTIGSSATVNASGFGRLAFAGSASLLGILTNSGTLNIASTALYLSYWPDGCSAHVVQSSGALNLQNNASIIFAQNGAQVSTNDFVQNGGSVTFYSDAGTTVGGTGALNLGNSGSANNTYTLAGGTLTVPQIQLVSGTGTFNFSGGTLKAAASSATFMQGLTAANVTAAGAIIDTAGNSITIGQALSDGGGGSLTKNGIGTLNLTGANTYTGNTIVNGGTLELAQATLATTASVTIASGAKMQLDFSGNNQVSALVLNGVSQPNGTYNVSSAPAYFAGTGSLVVGSTATNPTNITFSVSGSTLSLSWPADHLGWFLQQQTNSLSAGLGTNWVDVPGSSSITSTNITINPAKPTVFFRLRSP